MIYLVLPLVLFLDRTLFFNQLTLFQTQLLSNVQYKTSGLMKCILMWVFFNMEDPTWHGTLSSLWGWTFVKYYYPFYVSIDHKIFAKFLSDLTQYLSNFSPIVVESLPNFCWIFIGYYLIFIESSLYFHRTFVEYHILQKKKNSVKKKIS